MADTTTTAINAALAQNYRDPIIRTFNGRSTLAKTLPVLKGEGKNCAWTWEGTGAVAENHAEGADVSSTGSDTFNAATLSWGLYRSNFLVTDLAASSARTSRTPLGAQMQLGRNVENGARKLASTINAAGFAGAGTGTLICGLDVALSDSNTYAGVDRSQAANAGFRAKVIDPGTATSPTFALLRKDLSDIHDLCGETPDLAFCASAEWQKIASLYDEQRRYNQSITEISTAKGKVTLDASVGALELDGCIFIKDKDATAGSIYYVNSNYVHLEYLPLVDEEALREMMRTTMNMDDGYGPMPLGMEVIQLARAGAARKWTMEVQVQLVVAKPNACGIRLNVDAT